MNRLAVILVVLVTGLAIVGPRPAGAVNPDEVLSNPKLELRAREISKELRCVVCQNQSIDDSDAELARDLRILVRERLEKGESDSEVIDFVVARYGDFVLLRPPFKGITYLLWFGPLLFVVIGVGALFAFYRRSKIEAADAASKPAALSAEEQRRLDELMQEETN